MPRTVLVTDHDFDDLRPEREVLGGLAEVRALSDEPGDIVTDDRLGTADAVLNLRATLDAPTIEAMSNCRIIARYGTGVDNVDTEAAAECGIYVTNVPGYCVEEVSTHALSLILAALRRVPTYDRSVEAGEWDREVGVPIHRFSTRTVGVVGFGAIGRAVGEKVGALGADVLASDPFLNEADLSDVDTTLVAFEELIEAADVVTIHAPLTEATRGLFDADVFERMNADAYLVNVARGPIVDGETLRAALEAGEIGGACLDVFPEEPPAPDDPLRTREDVLTTPHVAWYSEEANAERRRSAATAVRAALVGERPEHVVNDPQ